jgi:hypothetical protein
MTDLTDVGLIVLSCANCAARSTADPKHLANLLAAGPWRCDDHKEN